MAYKHINSKGVAYFLHANVRKLASGKEQRLFFFSKTVKEGALDAVPAGYVVSESANGLPLLKRAP
jgi:hypothetical protein